MDYRFTYVIIGYFYKTKNRRNRYKISSVCNLFCNKSPSEQKCMIVYYRISHI